MPLTYLRPGFLRKANANRSEQPLPTCEGESRWSPHHCPSYGCLLEQLLWCGTSLAVLRLRLLASTAEDTGRIPGWETKMPYATGQLSPHTTTDRVPWRVPFTTRQPAHLSEDSTQHLPQKAWYCHMSRQSYGAEQRVHKELHLNTDTQFTKEGIPNWWRSGLSTSGVGRSTQPLAKTKTGSIPHTIYQIKLQVGMRLKYKT